MTGGRTLDLFFFLSQDVEDSIAALCVVASIAHAQGNYGYRDDAVNFAEELAHALKEDAV